MSDLSLAKDSFVLNSNSFIDRSEPVLVGYSTERGQTSFCKAKDTVNKTKRHLTEWEKIFTNLTSDRGLISKIYKGL